MTPEEMKKFDRKVRAIQDPYGTGYKVLRRLLREEATKRGIPYFDLLQLYLSWKTIQE